MVGYLHYTDKSILTNLKINEYFGLSQTFFNKTWIALGFLFMCQCRGWLCHYVKKQTVFAGGENTRMHKVELIYQ